MISFREWHIPKQRIGHFFISIFAFVSSSLHAHYADRQAGRSFIQFHKFALQQKMVGTFDANCSETGSSQCASLKDGRTSRCSFPTFRAFLDALALVLRTCHHVHLPRRRRQANSSSVPAGCRIAQHSWLLLRQSGFESYTGLIYFLFTGAAILVRFVQLKPTTITATFRV